MQCENEEDTENKHRSMMTQSQDGHDKQPSNPARQRTSGQQQRKSKDEYSKDERLRIDVIRSACDIAVKFSASGNWYWSHQVEELQNDANTETGKRGR